MELVEYIKKLFARTQPVKGGVRSESGELRAKIALLIDKDIKQVCGLTRGWSNYTLLRSYEDAVAWRKNPGACWWVIYKKNKLIHGRRGTKATRVVGDKRRKKHTEKTRNKTLFESGDYRSHETVERPRKEKK